MSIKTEAKPQSKKKLEIKRHTLQDLTVRKDVKGGRFPESKYTYCGGDGCYKPNPY